MESLWMQWRRGDRMAETGMRNLTVMGESSTGGGKFEKMRVVGECEVHGDLDIGSCRVVGECAVYGDSFLRV